MIRRNPRSIHSNLCCCMVFALAVALGGCTTGTEDGSRLPLGPARSVSFGTPPTGSPMFVATWGSAGIGDGQFFRTAGVACDKQGNVYVVDQRNHRIQKFTADGVFLAKWGRVGTFEGQFQRPSGIAVGPTGEVYVTDGTNHRVQKFTSDGTFMTMWRGLGTPHGYLQDPAGVAVGRGGDVYVVDTGNDCVLKFTSDGSFVTAFGETGNGEGQFSRPRGIAVDGRGHVYVADTGNRRVSVHDKSGNFIETWGSSGTGADRFDEPSGVSVDRRGNVYVTDSVRQCVHKFTAAGLLLASWGRSGRAPGEFFFPLDLAADGYSSVFIADTRNNRVQKFDLSLPGLAFTGEVVDGLTGRGLRGITVELSSPLADFALTTNGHGKFIQHHLASTEIGVLLRSTWQSAPYFDVLDQLELVGDTTRRYTMIPTDPSQIIPEVTLLQLFKSATLTDGTGGNTVLKKWPNHPVPIYITPYVSDEGLDYAGAAYRAARRWMERTGIGLFEFVDEFPGWGIELAYRTRAQMTPLLAVTRHTQDDDGLPQRDVIEIVNNLTSPDLLYRILLHEFGHTIRLGHLPNRNFIMFGGQPLPGDITDDEVWIVKIHEALPNGTDMMIYRPPATPASTNQKPLR